MPICNKCGCYGPSAEFRKDRRDGYAGYVCKDATHCKKRKEKYGS